MSNSPRRNWGIRELNFHAMILKSEPQCPPAVSQKFSPSPFGWLWLILLLTLSARGLHAADQFGEISVSASAIYTGNTYHGYSEMRVLVENQSPSKTHV